MDQYTCVDHPGKSCGHDDCHGDGVSWTTIKLKTQPEYGNEFVSDLHHDAAMAHRLHRALEIEESEHSDFLAYMCDELARFPCMHEEGQHKGTPPVMWPDLIRCIVMKAVMRERQSQLNLINKS